MNQQQFTNKQQQQQQQSNNYKSQISRQPSSNINNSSSSSNNNNNNQNYLFNVKLDQQTTNMIYLDRSLSDDLVKELAKTYIYPLKKLHKDKEMARYLCKLCNYHCNTLEIALKHKDKQGHIQNLQARKHDLKIRELTLPSKSVSNELTNVLIQFHNNNCCKQSEINQRYDLFYDFKMSFLNEYPNANVHIYGSTASGFCLKTSPIDINVCIEDKNGYETVELMHAHLKSKMNDKFYDIKIDGNMNQNRIIAKSMSLMCYFTSIHSPHYYRTSILFNYYSKLDQRFRILAFCFRYLANMAKIDKVDLNTLPPHCYIIMTIYFLQTIKPPVLPALHQIMFDGKLKFDEDVQQFDEFTRKIETYIDNNAWKSENCDDIGTLWVKLLAFYSNDYAFKDNYITIRTTEVMGKGECKFFGKKIAVEDPFHIKQNLCKCLLTQTNDYLFRSIRKACFYFTGRLNKYEDLIEAGKEGHSSSSLVVNKKSERKRLIEQLIVETGLQLKDYNDDADADESDTEQQLIKSRHESLSKESTSVVKKSSSIKLALNDDLSANLEKVTSNAKLKDKRSISECLDTMQSKDKLTTSVSSGNTVRKEQKTSLNVDFTIDSSSDLLQELAHNRYTDEDIEEEDDDDDLIGEDDVEEDDDEDDSEDEDDESTIGNNRNESKSDLNLNQIRYGLSNVEISDENDVEAVVKGCLNNLIKNVESIHKSIYHHKPIISNYEPILSDPTIFKTQLSLKFQSELIGFDREPPLCCSLCNKEGHLNKDCPLDSLPDIEKLPDFTHKWDQILTQACMKIMEDSQQTCQEERIRNELLETIKNLIKQKYEDVELQLFGSSNNGFGMKKSDLDICMTLKRYTNSDSLTKLTVDFKSIIKNVSNLIRNNRDFENIEERHGAKVPIVKFRNKKYKLEGDISIYNTLALHNTELLRAYASIDKRVKPLGHVVKHFAKCCKIGDASCGSLSSYAYIIMMIHYLMKTEPPVLPCLQKICDEKNEKKKVNIDGWDCWFYRDLENLPKIWKHFNKNKQSVGDLWLGFLRYYTEVFDWKTNVVTIKDDEYLSRKVKNWTKTRLAIEDPFELSHNLAAGVSHKMGIYILKSFLCARSHFGIESPDLRLNEAGLNIEYFFNPKSLVDGYPPMDRNCFHCSKIGHMTKECPNLDKVIKRRPRNRKSNKELANSENKLDFASTIQCYKCKSMGHMVRDCPQNTNGNRCFTCNQVGHLSKECTGKQQTLSSNNNNMNSFNATQNASSNMQSRQQQLQRTPQQNTINFLPGNSPIVKNPIQITANGGASTVCLTIPQQQQQVLYMQQQQQQQFTQSQPQQQQQQNYSTQTSTKNSAPTPLSSMKTSFAQQRQQKYPNNKNNHHSHHHHHQQQQQHQNYYPSIGTSQYNTQYNAQYNNNNEQIYYNSNNNNNAFYFQQNYYRPSSSASTIRYNNANNTNNTYYQQPRFNNNNKNY